MRTAILHRLGLTAAAALAAVSCGWSGSDTEGLRGRQDTGWLASTSYEVSGYVTAELTHVASGRYAELADDRLLQEELIEDHFKYGKPTMLQEGYQMGQLAEEIEVQQVEVQDPEQEGDDPLVTVRYRVKLNLIHTERYLTEVPALEDLEQTEFALPLPADPVRVYARAGKGCASGYGDYILNENKFYYYFHPELPGCDLPLTTGQLEITEVLPSLYAYPEYDRLLQPQEDDPLLKGFTVAVMAGEAAATGRRHLESRLGLEQQNADEEDPDYERYVWQEGNVRITIDLYDRASGGFTQAFHAALGTYDVVYYHGHSNYGGQPYLSDPDVYADKYQIISMNSCRNYSYYTEQVFRGKATAEDPRGFDAVDFLANGDSGWVSRSFISMPILLENLMAGAQAIDAGRPEEAPSWLDVVQEIDRVDPGVFYGVAGVRGNSWTPESATAAP